MESMKRRTFSLILAFGLLLNMTAEAADQYQPKLGLQTWTCRNMDFDQMIAFAVKHKLKYIQPFSKHINPMGTKEETLAKKAVLDKHGLACYTFGVTRTYKEKEQNRKLFEFAKLMGIKVIVVEPGDLSQWDVLEELVKEYDIKLAIHNHGINSTYGSPAKVWKVIRNRDMRIGVCMDVGHITGAGFDAAKAFVEYEGRVYDIHLKDKKVEKVGDKSVLIDVKVGTGDSNYAGLFKELRKAKWEGVLAIETDNGTFARNPTDFVVAAIQYVKKNH